MKSISILRSALAISAVLVVLIYFLYPTFSWPIGLEALECLLAIMHLIILGAIMGVILGTIGGIAGKLLGSVKIKNKPIPY